MNQPWNSFLVRRRLRDMYVGFKDSFHEYLQRLKSVLLDERKRTREARHDQTSAHEYKSRGKSRLQRHRTLNLHELPEQKTMKNHSAKEWPAPLGALPMWNDDLTGFRAFRI